MFSVNSKEFALLVGGKVASISLWRGNATIWTTLQLLHPATPVELLDQCTCFLCSGLWVSLFSLFYVLLLLLTRLLCKLYYPAMPGRLITMVSSSLNLSESFLPPNLSWVSSPLSFNCKTCLQNYNKINVIYRHVSFAVERWWYVCLVLVQSPEGLIEIQLSLHDQLVMNELVLKISQIQAISTI